MRLPELFSVFRGRSKSRSAQGQGAGSGVGSPPKLAARGSPSKSYPAGPDSADDATGASTTPPRCDSPSKKAASPEPRSPRSPKRGFRGRARTFSDVSAHSAISAISVASSMGSEGQTRRGAVLTGAKLMQTMEEVELSVRPVEAGQLVRVRTLQDAGRNQGSVELARSIADGGGLVAVKRMPLKWIRSGSKEFNGAHLEATEKPWVDLAVVKYLHSVGYPYICEPRGIFRDGESMHVVTSLATEGDLCAWCDQADPAPGTAREEKLVPLAAQIFQAVKWLHELGIAHRDLSLENILLNELDGEQTVKIIDFAMSTLTRSTRNELRGKASYQAPEMHGAHKFSTFGVDIFAIGVILFTLAAQSYPWKSTKRNTCEQYELARMMGLKKFVQHQKLHGNGRMLSQVFSPDFVEMLEGLLDKNPEKRLTLGECTLLEKAPGRTSVWGCTWLEGKQHMGLVTFAAHTEAAALA